MPREAGAEDIRKAYRHLARQYHPDVNPGDTAAEDRFKEVSEAYAVLSDDQKRRDYDEFGEVSLEGGFDREAARRAREAFGARFGAGGEPGFAGEGYSYGDLDEMLSHLFGRAGHSGGPAAGFAMRGADLESELELEFLEAARGTEKQLALARPDAQGGVVRETVTVRIPDMPRGEYAVRLYDTEAGEWLPETTVQADGSLTVKVAELSTDIAVRIERKR